MKQPAIPLQQIATVQWRTGDFSRSVVKPQYIYSVCMYVYSQYVCIILLMTQPWMTLVSDHLFSFARWRSWCYWRSCWNWQHHWSSAYLDCWAWGTSSGMLMHLMHDERVIWKTGCGELWPHPQFPWAECSWSCSFIETSYLWGKIPPLVCFIFKYGHHLLYWPFVLFCACTWSTDRPSMRCWQYLAPSHPTLNHWR